MMESPTVINKLIYYRLIALWVICEAFIGGIIHGMKIPVSGLLVGSCAVLIICQLAFHVPIKGAIIKATIIVTVFKLMLSPQSPPAAYIAVLFQGFVGELLFSNKKFFRASCILLGFLALFESAVQRIIVLMIVYGNDFWHAVNEFIRRLFNETVLSNYSLYLAIGYIILHSIVGIFVGWFAGMLCIRSGKWQNINKEYIFESIIPESEFSIDKKSETNPKLKTIFILCWILLAILLLQPLFSKSNAIIPLHISLKIFLRSVFIILSWYLLISPLLLGLMKKWLHKEESKLRKDILEILQILPSTKFLLSKSWKYSASKTGIKRIVFFIKIVLMNTTQSANE